MPTPGEWLIADDPIEINVGRRVERVLVRNTGDRPVQVGSHYHFFEVNRALEFDRPTTLGMRLNVPSGQSVRFEAGDEREVELVDFGGTRRIVGFSDLVGGGVDTADTRRRALRNAIERGFVPESTGGEPIRGARS